MNLLRLCDITEKNINNLVVQLADHHTSAKVRQALKDKLEYNQQVLEILLHQLDP